MEEILRLTIDGKFNGRDATLSIGLDAESAFEIEDVGTESPDEPETPSDSNTTAMESSAETATQPTHTEPISDTAAPTSTEVEDEPETAEADSEPAEEEVEEVETEETESETDEEEKATGLGALFPTERYDPEDLPPFSAGTKQFKVAEAVFESNGSPIRVREITDKLQDEEGEDEWNDSKVASHLHTIKNKEIVDREKHKPSGKWQYYVTDLGEAAIKHARRDNDSDEDDADAEAAPA